MSGDVQPRKRRDKKKRRDDAEESSVPRVARAPTPLSLNDDQTIHVHKESHLGGGICAKIVFFILLSILAVLIGLIITEHRGLTDLDTIQTDTRFSQYFEGWVDKTDDHDDHHDIHAIESHEHEDEEHAEHEDEHDDEHEDDHEEEHDDEHDDEHSEEHEEEEEEEESVAASEEPEESAQEDEEEQSLQEDDEDEQSVQEDDDDEGTQEDDATQEDEGTQEDDTQEVSQQEDEEASKQDDEDEASKQDEDDEASKEDDDADEVSAPQSEEAASPEVQDDEDSAPNDEDDNDEDEGPASKEEDDANSPETDNDEGDDQEEEDGFDKIIDEGEEDPENTETNVVVKVGVGVAILVVAYVVLVRKWKSDKPQEKKIEKGEVLDLSRRNTIVVPPKVEEVEQVIDNDDEEYSEEEIEEDIKLPPKTRKDYQQLRSTYERSLSPESDTQDRGSDEYDEGDDDGEYDDEENVEEEEEEEVDEEQISDVDLDDEELMKKLEAKYGKIEGGEEEEEEEVEGEEEDEEEGDEEDSEDEDYWKQRAKPSSGQAAEVEDAPSHYILENITNSEDMVIHEALDKAQDFVEGNAALALSLFNEILKNNPQSPRTLYGKAKALDKLAEEKRSNDLLKSAIANYMKVLKLDNTPSLLVMAAADRCIDRMRFIGQYSKAVLVHNLLIKKFPNIVKFQNQLAVTYLTMNRIEEAREVLQKILFEHKNNGFALVHYGFLLKVNDGKLEKAVTLLRKGLQTKEEGVIDGRFYFHLGDALIRLGRANEAREVHLEGVQNGIFYSEFQRSLYNVKGLTARPWWNKADAPKYKEFFTLLEKNYKQIRDEGLAMLNQKGLFQDEAENLRNYGDWKQLELYARGIKQTKNCLRCPKTCQFVEKQFDAVGCRRGQIKFSVMHPNTHVWPHCGPTNCRLRAHLGLKVPDNTYIRVGKETKSWKEGKVLIFDDSFEHEVWHNGTGLRMVLIVDVWHPELTIMEKQSLSAI